MSKTEELVEALAVPIAEEAGVEVYDVEYKKEGRDWFLRVFIYSEKGITIEDCEAVSRRLSDELDRLDPIQTAYCLEVSSPGIERALKRERHFETAVGEEIEIKLFTPYEGKKEISGVLREFNNDTICLQTAEEITEIPRADVAKAHVLVRFFEG